MNTPARFIACQRCRDPSSAVITDWMVTRYELAVDHLLQRQGPQGVQPLPVHPQRIGAGQELQGVIIGGTLRAVGQRRSFQ